ncbi:NAD(P)/FAD-dependent oxidoreductase [Halobacteriovorax sp. RT-1-4]|uniref:NAD(P)/FAD-dependent oxidoreductase n=1 Tax=unclassified Halobacteriovorax TaxID=2639665 RepID=UPI00399A4C12
MKKIKVVIIGAGFAGIALAKGLANKDYFEVVILDKKNHHLFHPLLYQVASASLSPGDISMPIREILSHAKNIKVHMQEVVSIDKDLKVIECKSGDEYQYDYLAVATGSKPFYFGNDDWEKSAPGLKTLTDALSIRDRVLNSFEKEEIKLNQEEKKLNIVIIGGGLTGVELAGAFAEVAYKTLVNEYHDFDPKLTKIYLIEGGQHILSSYSHPTSEKAKNYLEKLGVIVLTDEVVEEIGDDYIKTKSQKIESKNIIWAAGNRATKLISKLGVEQDRMGRAIVEKDLSLKDFPEIFILGDAANFQSLDGSPLPSLAPVAAQQGKHLAKQLLKNKRFAFKYLDKGSMATVGKYKAVLEWKGVKLAGPIAWLAWSLVHIFFLINFRNKVMVFMQWAWSLLSNKRRIRIIK